MWWRLALVGVTTLIVLGLLLSQTADAQLTVHDLTTGWSDDEANAEIARFARFGFLTMLVSILSVLLASGLMALHVVRRHGAKRR